MKQCPDCSTRVRDDARICPACGRTYSDEENAAAAKRRYGNAALLIIFLIFLAVLTRF